MRLYPLALSFILSIFSSTAYAENVNGMEDKSSLLIALVQLRTDDVGNFNKMKGLARLAREKGADLIVFPEDSVLGWLNPVAFTDAEPIPGKYSDKLVEIARSEHIWIAAGLAERGPKAGAGALPNAYEAYDSAILINANGDIVLHHRQFDVVRNSFDPTACKAILNKASCNYTPGLLSDIAGADTPFGELSFWCVMMPTPTRRRF